MKITARLLACSGIIKEFGSDESGKGLATYGLVISGIVLVVGLVYGIFMHPGAFGDAKPASCVSYESAPLSYKHLSQGAPDDRMGGSKAAKIQTYGPRKGVACIFENGGF